jgi:hypothetical protein
MKRVSVVFLGALFLLASCNKTAGNGPHATVAMRDGTSASGTIVASSPSEVQLAGDDQVRRTIPMTQVRSIQYDEPASSPSTAALSPSDAASNRPAAPAGSALAATEPRAVAPPPEIDPAHDNHYHPPQTAVTTKLFELPEGTQVSVRTEETIDSGRAVEGQTFAGEVTANVRDAGGDTVIPRGANADLVIRSVSKGGKIRGASDLVVDLSSISIDGQLYQVSAGGVHERGKSGVGANKRTAVFTGGGAAFGAIIGAIAGGGKGAAIGAAAGAGAGATTQVLTKGKIKIPAETVLTFKLQQPLRVEAAQ